MNLSNNVRSAVLTGRQKLFAFSDQLRTMVDSNVDFLNHLNHGADLMSEVESIMMSDYTAEEKRTLIGDYISDHFDEYTDYQYNTTTDGGNLIRYQVTTDEQAESLNFDLKVIDPDDDSVVTTHNLLEVNHGNVDNFHDILDYQWTISEDESLSFRDICLGVQETNVALQVSQYTSELYASGQLTIANLKNRLDGVLDVTNDNVKSIINVIIENISVISVSYENFIEFMKNLLSKIKDMTLSGGKFVYGVDTYQIDTHIFLGIGTVVQIATTLISLVVSIFAPIVGVVISAVGTAASMIISSIEENTRSTALFPDDPSFSGYGQNISRVYVRDNAQIIYKMFTQSSNAIICVSTPLTTSIIYNSPVKDSSNYDVYPCQEFIIPFIPLDPAVCTKCQEMISNGNTESWIAGTTGVGEQIYQRNYTVGIAGQNFSSQSTRFNKYIELMTMINNYPDKIHYVNNSDPDAVQLFATWYSSMLFYFATRSLTEEYSNVSMSALAISTAMAAIGTSTIQSMDDICNKNFLTCFSVFNKCLYEAITLKSYSIGTTSPGDWFYSVINNTWDAQDNTYLIMSGWYYMSNSWAKLTNDILLYSPGYVTFFSLITGVNIDNIPLEVYSILPSDPLNPSIVPPESSLNIWARLAITIGAIAAIIVTATIASTVIRRTAQKKFLLNANNTSNLYSEWLDNPTKANWKAYRKSCFKTNIIGKLFGLGSYDAANGWINRPENNIGVLSNKLSELSGNNDGTLTPTVKDVLTVITG